VFDSWALLAWLDKDEPAATVVHRLLDEAASGKQRLHMSLINFGEVSSTLFKRHGAAAARRTCDRLSKAPIQFEPADEQRIRQAADLKGRYAFSYADAFAAALALELGASLATGDPEMQEVERGEGLKVHWLNGP
jgi:predicted nucleic acid-binding protein